MHGAEYAVQWEGRGGGHGEYCGRPKYAHIE
jgi:hypothetical protein